MSLCIERQLVNGAYFLDEMPLYELNIYIQNINNYKREEWEMTRFLGYIIAQVNSTKRLSPSDIMSFPWEKDIPKIEEEKPTMQDKQYLQNKANEYAKLLNIND